MEHIFIMEKESMSHCHYCGPLIANDVFFAMVLHEARNTAYY